MTESTADRIIFLKKEIKQSEDYIAECKKALAKLAEEAWSEGVRDVGGLYEVRENRPAPLNTTTFRNVYPELYKGTVELLQDAFVPEITKASITRYLEMEQYDPEEIARIIEECSEPSDKVSYNVYAYPKNRGVQRCASTRYAR